MKMALSSCTPMIPNQILFSNYMILCRKFRSSETGVTSAPGGVSVYEKLGWGETKEAFVKAVFQRRQKEKNRFGRKGNMQDMVCLRSGEGGGEFMKLLNIGHDVSSI
jgi:hypothetical protein